MINKFLFYFISRFNKKINILRVTDEYCFDASCAFVSMTMAVGLYAVINVISIVFIRSSGVHQVLSTVMNYICLITSLLSFLYFSHNDRWNVVYGEINRSSRQQKIKYGVFCLLYVSSAYGLWFFSNDVIRVLNTGNGSFCAMKIVDILKLNGW